MLYQKIIRDGEAVINLRMGHLSLLSYLILPFLLHRNKKYLIFISVTSKNVTSFITSAKDIKYNHTYFSSCFSSTDYLPIAILLALPKVVQVIRIQ